MTEEELLAAHKNYTDNMGYSAGKECSKEETEYWANHDAGDNLKPYEVIVEVRLIVAASMLNIAEAKAFIELAGRYGDNNVIVAQAKDLTDDEKRK